MAEFKTPLAIDANNWFSIHANPGVNWEGRKKKEDKKHKIIEEFYDPVDSTRAIYRNFWTRNLRNNRGSTFKVGDIFDKKDAFGVYAKDPKPYFDTLEDFGYTLDSVIDLRDRDSIGKFFNYLASIEIGREYFDKNISQEEKQRVINEGINKGLDSLINDEDYKYKDQFNKEMSTPLISIEFGEDKEQMQQGGFIRQPKMINDPNAAPAALRADDIELQAQEGDFIMGYPAMQQSGTRVRSLVEQAMLKAKNAGVKTKGYKKGDKVDILVHNKEMHIPKEIIPYIGGGYTTLKKLNAPSKYAVGDYITDKQAMNKELIRREKLRGFIDPEEDITARDFAISGRKESEERRLGREELERQHRDVRGVHKDEELLTSVPDISVDFSKKPIGKSTDRYTMETARDFAVSGRREAEEKRERREELKREHDAFKGVHKYDSYIEMNKLLEPEYEAAVEMPTHGSVLFAGDYPINGKMAWAKADKIMKSIFRSNEFDNKSKRANKMLYVEAMENLKNAIESGIDSKSQFNGEKLVNKQFLKNVAKTTETAHLLNKANFVVTKEQLHPTFTISQTGLKVHYKDGTPAIFGKGIKPKTVHDDTEKTLRYEFDESYNPSDNWHKTDGMKFQVKHKLKDSNINSKGGDGYSGRNHTIKFNKDYNPLVKYLKRPDIEGFSSTIYNDGGYPSIGFGHKLTKKEIEKYKDGIEETEAEDLLLKDIMEAENNIKVVYNKFIKSKGYTENAARPFRKLDTNLKMMLIEMAFNMGASKVSPDNLKGFPILFDAIAKSDYNAMIAINSESGVPEYHRTGVSEERNTEFRKKWIDPQLGKFNLKEGL